MSQSSTSSAAAPASFGGVYSHIYDALYREKDYEREARFVLERIRTAHDGPVQSLLDLGCGTGLHDIVFAREGVRVTGIDRSAEMLAVAQRRRDELPDDLKSQLEFGSGDIRRIDLGQRFDVVVSLFHVLSYMVEDADLNAMLACVQRHLSDDGIFVADFWHGPTVLRHPPIYREKTVEADGCRIRRKSIPTHEAAFDRVRVSYELEITNLTTGVATQEREQHLVRYLFPDDLRKRLADIGLETVQFGEWLADGPPTADTFNVFLMARRGERHP